MNKFKQLTANYYLSKRLLTLLLACLLISTKISASFKFDHFTVDDGLSQGTIIALFQDQQGYIWMGTEDGLNRFDGYDFVTYSPSYPERNLVGRKVNTITADLQGNLWVGTNNGISWLPANSETFIPITVSNSTALTNNIINILLASNSHKMWIGTNDGLFYADQNNQIQRFKLNLKQQPAILSLLQFSPNKLWIGTIKGVFELLISTGNTQLLQVDINKEVNQSLIASKLYQGSQSGIWLGTRGNGLYHYLAQRGQFIHYDSTTSPAFPENTVYAMAEDNKGRLWLDSDSHGAILYHKNDTFEMIKHDVLDPKSISNNSIGAIFRDREGNMWVGTNRGGINLHRPITEYFSHIKESVSSVNGLLGNDTRALAVDHKQQLWVGIAGHGLSVYSRSYGILKHITPAEGLKGVEVYTITVDNQGWIWVGTESALNKIDPDSLTVVKFYEPKRADGTRLVIISIDDDNQGSLWLTHQWQGASRFNKHTGQSTYYNSDNRQPFTSYISDVFVDNKNNVWLTGDKGLLLYRPETDSFESFPLKPHRKELNNLDFQFSGLYGDSQGRLWLSENNGVYLFDIQTRQQIQMTLPQFLTNETIYDIQQDINGRFWATSNKGLVTFIQGQTDFRLFVSSDGIQSNEFNAGAATSFNNGMLAFGGINGTTYFQPEELPSIKAKLTISSIEAHSVQPPFKFTRFIDTSSSFQLTHDYAWFSLAFANLSFEHPKKNHFAYRILGLSENWVDIGNTNKITIPSLPSGNYQFELAIKDQNHNWNPTGAGLEIKVLYPWYQTPVAYVCYAILFLSGIYSLYLIKSLRIRKHSEILRKEVKQRTQTIVAKNIEINKHAQALVRAAEEKNELIENLSHELRTPITLILGPVRQLGGKVEDPKLKDRLQLIERNTLRLNRLVNQLLDLSNSQSIKSTKQSHSNISQQAIELALNFQPYALNGGISLETRIVEHLYVPYSNEELEQILSNLLSNAIKYNQADGHILLEICKQQDTVVLTVKDTGIGMEAKHLEAIFKRFYRVDAEQTTSIEGSGVGLNIVKNIILQHKDDISLISEPGKGTTFTLKLGLTKASVDREKLVKPLAMDIAFVSSEDDQRQTLLIIDDNKDMLGYLSSLFAEHYQVQIESDSLKGLELARTTIPDIIISDVMMPNLTGMELLKTLKNDELTNHIPIILLTAKGSEKSRIQGLSLHADAYLSKPFNEDEIFLCIRNLLETRDILKKRYAAELLNSSKSAPEKPRSKFINKLNSVIDKHYSDPNFSVTLLSVEMALSERQLLRKLKAITDSNVKEYIRTFRLKKAAEMLAEGATPSNVALDIGFSSLHYFSTCFKAHYGRPPSHFQGAK